MTSPPDREVRRVWTAELSTLDLGDVTVTFLPDGVHHVEGPRHYPDAPEGLWEEHPEVINDEGLLVMSVGGFLVRTSSHNILVDLGFGPHALDMTALTNGRIRGDMIGGDMIASLAKMGLTPADIHEIFFSHLHMDHIGWLMNPDFPDQPMFAGARYVLNRAEFDYWANAVDAPQPVKGVRGGPSGEELAVIERAARWVEGREEVLPGVVVVPTPGHTCGHTSVLVTGSDGRVLIIGDAMHCPVELQHHGLTYSHDQDHVSAATSRETIHAILTEEDSFFAGVHFPGRVFGRLSAGDRFHDYGIDYHQG